MDNLQSGHIFYKIAAIASPFIAAAMTGVIAYYFGKKGKKLDILHANKVPAVKSIAAQLN